MTQKVQQLEQILLLQFQWNRDMDNKMGNLDSKILSLETTTQNTDTKIDMILGKLDSWDVTAKRRGVQPVNDERTAPILHQNHCLGAMST
jgi:hypothetical protein